ncbi:30S ribosomal protein S9 [Streptomyces aidingensis]|uniref:Small ribosomal subunit protein uS9 n=1 Tax=Streptomyces aidingensis TaxID=910347 RepID=A0A1I1EDE7_9ACTN|nr:30S ribosomal protein S9 [Streptomyces aidingensis]SFB83368.1 small subunit ribosomal protein S9 [Streptomyces aidingensis]
MADTTEFDAQIDTEEPEVQEYTSESAPVEEYSTETLASRFGEAQPGAGTGRRKSAVARVRIMPGSGKWKINGRPLDVYFPNKVHQQEVNEPFKVLELDNRYDVVARISGGGTSGQAGALRLGVARALNEADVDNNRGPLKKAGFLTRDARAVERKKAGLKKARKGTQYSKR